MLKSGHKARQARELQQEREIWRRRWWRGTKIYYLVVIPSLVATAGALFLNPEQYPYLHDVLLIFSGIGATFAFLFLLYWIGFNLTNPDSFFRNRR